MSTAVEGLKPELLWKYFAEISRIPRGSKNEAAISRYVRDIAKKLGLSARADRLGNVVVEKPASPGRDQVRRVALQAHLDMVCEKNKDKVHDFLKDPIEIVRRGNLLMANGTTLGADNGIGVATNLAIMEDTSLEHGPLELLFTVDEETGLTGARNLEPDFLKSRTLLNMDSEEEGAFYVGCAGGRDTLATWKVHFEPPAGSMWAVRVAVSGLKGGHSGLEIDKGRANAIKIMGRVLVALDSMGARLSSIEGGNKRNAIPRECEALVLIPVRKLADAEKIINDLQATIKAEFAVADPDLFIRFDAVGARKKARAMGKSEQRKILQAITALPHGVIKMSADIPGLVETSTNLAIIQTTRNAVKISSSQRSSVASELSEIADTIKTIFELAGASVESPEGYPGWKPNMDSPVLSLAKSVYRSLYGKEPEVKAVHAGLECGIIGERFPGMDMISMGPTLEGVHSPDEKVHIDTVERFWEFLLELLKRIE